MDYCPAPDWARKARTAAMVAAGCSSMSKWPESFTTTSRTLSADVILKSPLLWHFRFGGPDMERLVAGATAFGTSFQPIPSGSAKPLGALLCGPLCAARQDACRLLAFCGVRPDVVDNSAFLARGRLKMPVLALGGESSLGATMATVMRAALVPMTS
jgi:hypothetical protein